MAIKNVPDNPSAAEQMKKDNVLQALLTTQNVNEAAKAAGVSRKTIYTYMNTDSELLLAYRDAKREQLRILSERMSDGATKATEYILSLIDNEEAPATARLKASVSMLELYIGFRNLEGSINESVLRETGSGKRTNFFSNMSEIEYPNSL